MFLFNFPSVTPIVLYLLTVRLMHSSAARGHRCPYTPTTPHPTNTVPHSNNRRSSADAIKTIITEIQSKMCRVKLLLSASAECAGGQQFNWYYVRCWLCIYRLNCNAFIHTSERARNYSRARTVCIWMVLTVAHCHRREDVQSYLYISIVSMWTFSFHNIHSLSRSHSHTYTNTPIAWHTLLSTPSLSIYISMQLPLLYRAFITIFITILKYFLRSIFQHNVSASIAKQLVCNFLLYIHILHIL